MKIKRADYSASAVEVNALPPGDLPEFALIGRSNVGKSSLLNAICGRRKLAFVSNKPGRTRTISLFDINKTWRLVDLPGYGFASTGKDMRHRFGTMVSEYILHREALRCLMVLIDSKIPPQQIDLDFLQWIISEGVPFVLVFTKIDRVSPKRLQANIDAFLEAMTTISEGDPMYLACSARTRAGIPELHAVVLKVLEKEGRQLGDDLNETDDEPAIEDSDADEEEADEDDDE